MWVVKEDTGMVKGFAVKPYYVESKWGVSVENGIPIFGFNFNEYIVLALDPEKFPDIELNNYFKMYSELKVNEPIEVEIFQKLLIHIPVGEELNTEKMKQRIDELKVIWDDTDVPVLDPNNFSF